MIEPEVCRVPGCKNERVYSLTCLEHAFDFGTLWALVRNACPLSISHEAFENLVETVLDDLADTL